jgi:uncharacterized protein
MAVFIGRKNELETLGALLKKKSASLAVIKGRRRIGKSRLVEEFSKKYPFEAFYTFSALPPTRETTAQSQRDAFASQLGAAFGIPGIRADDWATLFSLLDEKVKQKRSLILFDEISWMGSEDPDFLGKLKNAWDLLFKKNDRLILILCGSVSSWIEENILGSTGFLGRISLALSLKELPLPDCTKFWGATSLQVSAFEKFKVLAITGGVPLYLEHIDPKISAEENITALCFRSSGLLFREFDDMFSDLFSKRSVFYKAILQALANGSATQEEVSQKIGLQRSGDIKDYLEDLIKAGFVSRDHTWHLKSGKLSKLSHYRVCDNYSRFYLKYIEPRRHKIEQDQFTSQTIANLPNWSTIMGFQFENLVLNNRKLIWQILNISPEEIVCDNPFFQRPTKRYSGCQIDYLLQSRFNTVYICEIKFSQRELGSPIIQEVQEKINRLAIPRHFSYRPVLIHVNGVTEEVEESNFFSKIIDFGDLLR